MKSALRRYLSKISGAMVIDGDVDFFDWQWSPDGQWLAYRADQRVDAVDELFTSAPDGSLNIQVSGLLVGGGDVINRGGGSFRWSADSERLVYTADQLDDDVVELFVAAPDGSVGNIAISGEITENGDVFTFELQ